MSSSNCPVGTEYRDDAPWNQEDPKPRKVNVTVSITLSKDAEVYLNDYNVEYDMDEEGQYYKYYDYSDSDLKQAVKDQIILPNDKSKEFNDWVEDDFEVVINE